jgi:hypothetical protein
VVGAVGRRALVAPRPGPGLRRPGAFAGRRGAGRRAGGGPAARGTGPGRGDRRSRLVGPLRRAARAGPRAERLGRVRAGPRRARAPGRSHRPAPLAPQDAGRPRPFRGRLRRARRRARLQPRLAGPGLGRRHGAVAHAARAAAAPGAGARVGAAPVALRRHGGRARSAHGPPVVAQPAGEQRGPASAAAGWSRPPSRPQAARRAWSRWMRRAASPPGPRSSPRARRRYRRSRHAAR